MTQQDLLSFQEDAKAKCCQARKAESSKGAAAAASDTPSVVHHGTPDMEACTPCGTMAARVSKLDWMSEDHSTTPCRAPRFNNASPGTGSLVRAVRGQVQCHM